MQAEADLRREEDLMKCERKAREKAKEKADREKSKHMRNMNRYLRLKQIEQDRQDVVYSRKRKTGDSGGKELKHIALEQWEGEMAVEREKRNSDTKTKLADRR